MKENILVKHRLFGAGLADWTSTRTRTTSSPDKEQSANFLTLVSKRSEGRLPLYSDPSFLRSLLNSRRRLQGENQAEEEVFGPNGGRKDVMKDRRGGSGGGPKKSLDAKLGRKGEPSGGGGGGVGRAKLGRKRRQESDSDDGGDD
jgi:hypothetical protein